jgi:hypothetical protein
MMEDRKSVPLAQLAAMAGKFEAVSSWIEVTQPMIDAFAELTNDRQFIHVDPVRAKAETPFGGTIAHGFLTLSLLSQMAYEVLRAGGSGDVDQLRLRQAALSLAGAQRIAHSRPIQAAGIQPAACGGNDFALWRHHRDRRPGQAGTGGGMVGCRGTGTAGIAGDFHGNSL